MRENKLQVLSSERLGASAVSLVNVALALGVDAAKSIVSSTSELRTALDVEPAVGVVAVSADLLRGGGVLDLAAIEAALPAHVRHCLIFDVWGTDGSSRAQADATVGPFAVKHVTPTRYAMCAVARDILGPFAGLEGEYFPSDDVPVYRASEDKAPSTGQAIIEVDHHPVFTLVASANRLMFIWATSRVLDVNCEVDSDRDLSYFYLSMVAPLAFLRAAFANHCWHAAQPMARLTIDDPLIRPRYGFLSFDELLTALQRVRFGITVGFIPWNHRRTSRALAKRLASAGATFGICAHGCDHTNQEFAYVDAPVARTLGAIAASRMSAHQQDSGLSWDPVMIFPQGLFSAASMAAIADAGFLAAVNSTCFPHNDPTVRISLSELMEPAVTRFGGAPVFRRRYPHDRLGFAFDLFVGRPVLICEHHQFFREGFVHLEQLVDFMHSMEPRLQWPSLHEITARACRQRQTSEGWQVVFYGRELVWRNPSALPQCVCFRKRDPATLVSAVRMGSLDIPYNRFGTSITFDCEVPGHAEVHVSLTCRTGVAARATSFGVGYPAKVILRRMLSEFRDNWLSRQPVMLWLAKRIARALKATGDA
jgi:hypothetical protein